MSKKITICPNCENRLKITKELHNKEVVRYCIGCDSKFTASFLRELK